MQYSHIVAHSCSHICSIKSTNQDLNLQYFRDVGPSYIVTEPTPGLCELDPGISKGFWRKLEIGWGEAFFGDDHPHNISTPRCTRTTQYFTNKPPYADVWALGVLASSSQFLMFIKRCDSSCRSVKAFLAAFAFCAVFTMSSDWPTTRGTSFANPHAYVINSNSQYMVLRANIQKLGML